MASDMRDGDYLGAYRSFFVDFLNKVNPNDQLPIKTSGYDVTEREVVGEIVHMTLQYLDQQLCPPSLQCYIAQLVIEEIKATCRKQPESCGFRQDDKTYAPLKLMQAVASKVNEICQRYLENSRLALLPPPPSTPMPLTTAFAIKNNRRKMEDRHVILHDLNTIFNVKDDSIASYYAVFDGHAGYDAAVFCATHLHQYLAESRHYPTDPERALRDAFLTTDASFIEMSNRLKLSSGTTAVCALILNRKLYVAWVGDSQAALAKRGIVTQLVNPHKPDRNDERERVEEMGGAVMHLGIWRVNGNLAVSRAIGDAQYKPYVTGDPEIRCITMDGQEDFLIIACDGLWDCVTENEAATLVYRDLYRDPYDYGLTSQRLVEYAKCQGSIDNITVIVVFLATPRQIASRSTYGNPLLADVQMNNMEPDNRYLSNANGQYDVNTTFGKQQTTANNGSGDKAMEDEYWNSGKKSSNGKRHENGDEAAEYDAEEYDDDLGPETDVDAVDDVSETVPTLADVSRQLFTEKSDPSENYQNDERMDDDSPPSPNTKKSNQRALIPDADNVGDSEDSEDEWNYYRIDPNKEKDNEAGAAGFGPLPKAENEKADNVVSSSSEEHEDKIDHEEKPESSKKDTDSSSSDSESEAEIRTNLLIDTEISADTKFDPKTTEFKGETEDIDEQEEKKIRDEEGNKENAEEEDMDFQLNPNAAEFVPVSPTVAMATRIDLDFPISGSPLKQTPPMDDIKIPSKREFENEARHRPHEIEEKTACTNGNRLMDDSEDNAQLDKNSEETIAASLDESEVSSTKAEFGDESSFLTASEFHRTGVSTLDGSYTVSCGEFDDSSVDPMTKSFGPGDFMALGNTVDLNAVHDLTDTDLIADESDVTRETDETERFNLQNADIDGKSEKVESTIDTFANDRTDNLLDYSSPVPFPHSSVSEISSNLENTEIRRDDNATKSEHLQAEPKVEEKQIEEILKFDDFEINETPAQSQKSQAVPEIQDEKNVTTKLLEMDLEDRGSQDCEFEKCNVKWPADEGTKDITMNIDEKTDFWSNPVSRENLVETFATKDSLSDEKPKIEGSLDIDKITESLNDLCANEDLISSRHSSVPDVPVMQNPLDLNPVTNLTLSRENLVLDDDTYQEDFEASKQAESPEVGISPLIGELSKNPFDQMEFGDSSSHSKLHEIDILKTVDESENMKRLENDNLLECASPLENKSPLEDEIPSKQESLSKDDSHLEHESPVDEVNPLIDESPLEHECPLEHKSPLKNEIPLKDDSPLEPESPVKDENLSEHKSIFEDLTSADRNSPLEAENPLEQKNILEIEETANVSSGLKLSESLQEFTGLEQQLNPEKVSNGVATHENLMDTRNDETKDTPVTPEMMKMVSEEIENKITELVEEAETKKIDDKAESTDKASIVAGTVAATVAAVGTAVAAKTSKAKPPAGKVAQKSATTMKTSVNRSTPTSPTKPASATATRTSTITATKKTSTVASSAARPNKLETVGKTTGPLGAPPSTKTSATTVPKSTLAKSAKTTGRLSATVPRAKTLTPSSATKTTSLGEKKTMSNGDATKSNVTTTNRLSSTSARLPSTGSSGGGKTMVKSSSAASGPRTTISTTTTTMTSASSRPKTATATSTTASRITSKAMATTTGTVGTTTQRPKTAPSTVTTSLVGKSRLASSTKSPITEKHIKETANKQISSSRTGTTTTTSKTSRVSGNSSTTTSTRRLTATKSTSSSASTTNNTAAPVIPPPIRKPGSVTRVSGTKAPTTNGKANSTKTTSLTTTNKTKVVVENGIFTTEQNIESVTSTTTSDSNEEDVPKKDISPVEPTTDNQLIITAD